MTGSGPRPRLDGMVRRAVWIPVLALVLGSIALSRAQSGAADVVLRPGSGATVFGGWTVIPDAAAAGGTAVRHANAGAAKLAQALAQPVNYFEQTFVADAGIPYRLWLRGRAQSDGWANDSVFVQFNTSVEGGVAKYRLGTSSALEVNLEDCSGCGLAGWGWQDTGWGIGVLGPEVVFASSGTQRIRIQTREDGFTIDQIVLSPERYLRTAPGALKNDTTFVPSRPLADGGPAAISAADDVESRRGGLGDAGQRRSESARGRGFDHADGHRHEPPGSELAQRPRLRLLPSRGGGRQPVRRDRLHL